MSVSDIYVCDNGMMNATFSWFVQETRLSIFFSFSILFL
jgi:hypothetical protein